MVTVTKTEAVGKIVELAREVDIKDAIDWSQIPITQDQAYEMFAENVLTQMMSVPEEHREMIMLSTLTKLLVENFILNVKIKDKL
jgi:hypothetical protein|tara:strand:+ start:1438 stop:1692 length:255 start_codon:yes stop_codon:yes gene_type:complete